MVVEFNDRARFRVYCYRKVHAMHPQHTPVSSDFSEFLDGTSQDRTPHRLITLELHIPHTGSKATTVQHVVCHS